MRLALFLFLGLAIVGRAFADDKDKPKLTDPATFDSLITFLKDNPDIDSPQKLLGRLSPQLDANRFAIEDTGSQQEATSVHPRAIRFVDGATFAMAFQTKPGGKDKVLETWRWNPEKKEFEFQTIDFGNPKPPQKFSKGAVNPKVCAGCHADAFGQLLPKWDAYERWPGAERVSNRETLNKFTSELFQLNFQRFLAKFRKHPNYPHMRYAILGLLGCTYGSDSRFDLVHDEFLKNGEERKKFVESLKASIGEGRLFAQIVEALKKPADEKERARPGDPSGGDFFLQQVLKGMGDPRQNPFLSVQARTSIRSPGNGNMTLMAEMILGDPDLNTEFGKYIETTSAERYTERHFFPEHYKLREAGVCDAVRKRSLAAAQAFDKLPVAENTPVPPSPIHVPEKNR